MPRFVKVCVSAREARKKANQHGFAFHATFLLWLQGHATTSKRTNPSRIRQLLQRRNLWFSHESKVNAVQHEYVSSLPASTRKISGMPVLALEKTTQSPLLDTISLPIASFDALLATENAVYRRVCLCKDYKTSQRTSFQGTSSKVSEAFATPTLNSSRQVTAILKNNQVKNDFVIETALMKTLPIRRQYACISSGMLFRLAADSFQGPENSARELS